MKIFNWAFWFKEIVNFIKPFSTNVPFLNPLKTSENLRFPDIFRGFKGETMVENGLIMKLLTEKNPLWGSISQINTLGLLDWYLKTEPMARWQSNLEQIVRGISINPIPTRVAIRSLPVGLFVVTFDWDIQFCWNLLTFPKIYMVYMEWISQKKVFGIARIYGPGANFSTGGRIKI